MSDEEFLSRALRWRGVMAPCRTCHGSGVRQYGSGSTWRGGMGTASIEWDVCDICWGSGDAHRQGEDLRKLRDEEAGRVSMAAAKLWADAVGAKFLSETGPAITAIADELDVLARKAESSRSKSRPRWFAPLVAYLAKTLHRMVPPADRQDPEPSLPKGT